MRLRTIGLALVLASCDAITVDPTPPSSPAPPSETPVEEPRIDDRACGALTRSECMRAVHCTLEAAGSRWYVCRDARGNCEVGLRQIHEDRDRCADRVGCAWTESACYCACRGAGQTAVPDGPEAEACVCECAGGPPPGCRAR